MKIIAVGRNYVAHIEELNNEKPEAPVIFLKPETSLILNNQPFYFPDFSENIHYEAEIIVKINRNGKYIDKRFAHKYYDSVGIGIDFTARDLQDVAKQKGLPWDLAKGFNGSAPVSSFQPLGNYNDIKNINFSLTVNGETRQQGNTSQMLFDVDEIISYVSKFILLKKGDIIFTGTPQGVGPVKRGDLLEGFIENEKLLEVEIR